MKKIVTISIAVAAIALLAGLGQANAALLYSTAPPDLVSTGGYNGLAGTQGASNPFTLSSAATLTSVDVYVLANNGHTAPTAFSYAIGTSTWGTDITPVTVAPSPTAVDLGAGPFGGNYEEWKETFTISASLSAGTYWLSLTGAAAELHWTPSYNATPQHVGGTFGGPDVTSGPAQAFTIYGDVGGGAVPEPAGLGLIGLALLAVRKRRS